MRALSCLWMLAALGLAGCGDSQGDGDCTPHAGTTCEQGITYWVNSCDQREEERETCECGCAASGKECKDCNCTPQCAGRCCGPDSCGGVCPEACPGAQTCNYNTCDCEGECTPMTCAELGYECGTWDDGCGESLPCGDCPGGGACDANGRCPCTPGQTRCEGASYQTCEAGAFVETASCVAPEVCVPDLGCAACLPEAGDTCHEGNVHACNPDGTVGGLVQSCWTEPCVDGACGEPGCGPETQLIYVVDDAYRLLSFNPLNDAHEFTLIGSLDCPAGSSWPEWGGGSTATPFSMSVDREGIAWVLYTSGEIFWVSTVDAQCTASPYTKGQDDFKLFGMGFVTDEAGGTEEKLYIAGGEVDAQVRGDVAYIDPDTLDLTYVGQAPTSEYGPELTGTGKAELFGYFPGSSNTFIARIAKGTGLIEHQWPLPGLGSQVRAWAFAHWGGRFYVFVTTRNGSYDSKVLRLDPDSGVTDTLLEDLPYIIVGAGVSTCAPYE